MPANINNAMTGLDPLLDVFKLSGEPFEYLNESDVHHALTRQPIEYYQFVKQRLLNIAQGHATLIMPPKSVFTDNDTNGDFRIMPCIIEDNLDITKSVKLVGTNVIQECVPNQITVGKACILHPTENFITHIVEACLLSSARTAICAMLGIDLLSINQKKLTIIGAGRVGYYSAFYASALNWFEEVTIHDVDATRAHNCVNALKTSFPNIKYRVCLKKSLPDTDVLILATTSSTPIYSINDFRAQLIISVGADIDTQRELDDSCAKTAPIFVDSLDTARYGDIKSWLDNKLINEDSLIDLFTLLRDNNLISNNNQSRVFVSTGTAFFDNISLSYILKTL
ncbi:MAG: hypothetical protein COB22_04345 [Cycloclasticus sp.]|nr:MAG: hypothetical protein COB22_04345 [Cycloclasticus sp.]